MSDYVCPFCGERDFDAIGLKIHLIRYWCDVYNALPTQHPILEKESHDDPA